MANLTRANRYAKFAPDLGDNQTQDRPFYLLVASSMTKQAFLDFMRRADGYAADVKGADGEGQIVAAIAKVIGDCIKLGDEPLTLDGTPITTMTEYIAAVSGMAGGYNLFELIEAIRHFNSADGARALFYERHSGGFISTPSQKTGKAAYRGATH